MIKLKSNKIKYKTTLTIMFLLSGLFVLAGCGSGIGGGETAIGRTAGGSGGATGGSGVTPVSINLTVPGSGSSGAALSAAAASTPKPVCTLEIEIAGDGEIYVSEQYTVTPGEIFSETYEIPAGDNRTVTIKAFGCPIPGLPSELLYMGESIVDLSGEVTVPITIEMELVVDVDYAISLLELGDIVGARDLLRAAVLKYAGDGSANERNANFFYAITRIFAIWYDMEFDGVNDGLFDVGDILDAFDCSQANRDPDNFDIDFDTLLDDPVEQLPGFPIVTCPGSPLAIGAPSGQELQDFLYNVVRPELIGAIENLEQVSEIDINWSFNWDEPFDNTTVESDHGDVLVLKAMFKAGVAAIEIQYGYDLNLNIVGNDLDNIDSYGKFMISNPAYLTPNASMGVYLANAQLYLSNNALRDINDAVTWMTTQDDSNQDDDWISLVSWDGWDFQFYIYDNIPEAEKCVLGEECNIVLDHNKSFVSSDHTAINLAPYFNNAATNINSFLPLEGIVPPHPTSTPELYPIGHLPDETFGGMLIRLDGYDPSVLIEDLDEDGTDDSIDRNIYYVYKSFDPPAIPYSQSFRDDPESEGYHLMHAADPSNFADGPEVFYDNDDVWPSYGYYFMTSQTGKPTFVDRDDVTIDALAFIYEEDWFCCESSEFWVSNASLEYLFENQSSEGDTITGLMTEHDSVLVHDSYETYPGDGLKVYGIPAHPTSTPAVP